MRIRQLALLLARLKGINNQERKILLDSFTSSSQFLESSLKQVSALVGRELDEQKWQPALANLEAENDLTALKRIDGFSLDISSPEYPALLREIYNPPFLLYCRGSLPLSAERNAAIVGTRRPSGRAKEVSYRLAFELALNNCLIISGLALGVDSAAHRGCLDAGGRTLAVLGCGIDSIYPLSNKGLAARILENEGCLISEYPPGTAPLPYNFPKRNRIISGLSQALVMVQAPEKSGALISVDFALQQGRDVMVHAQGLSGVAGAGGRRLEREGAPLIQSALDYFKEMNYPLEDFKKAEIETEEENARGLASAMEKELQSRVWKGQKAGRVRHD